MEAADPTASWRPRLALPAMKSVQVRHSGLSCQKISGQDTQIGATSQDIVVGPGHGEAEHPCRSDPSMIGTHTRTPSGRSAVVARRWRKARPAIVVPISSAWDTSACTARSPSGSGSAARSPPSRAPGPNPRTQRLRTSPAGQRPPDQPGPWPEGAHRSAASRSCPRPS